MARGDDGRLLALGAVFGVAAFGVAGTLIRRGSPDTQRVRGSKTSDNPLRKLLAGRAVAETSRVRLDPSDRTAVLDKTRDAYHWIVNHAILSPATDIAYGSGRATLTDSTGDTLVFRSAPGYSSFVLVPLLNLLARRRMVLIGGPGRGKTTSALVMALLAGMSFDEVRRFVVRGHPQLTVSDLLGAPLPAHIVRAEELSEIRVAWRAWIQGRVKIIDEYNRIPTKTQSALLSLLGEGYAEMFDQYVHAGSSSWYLTANDEGGGGTFPVIEALKDRIDIMVRAAPFNQSFVRAMVERIESGSPPEESVIPREIVFSKAELDDAHEAIRQVRIPDTLLRRLAFFVTQFDFCRMASPVFEYKNKDTLRLNSLSVGAVCNETCPLDKKMHLCTQTENGISPRTLQSILVFTKAIAFFRGRPSAEWEDVRQIVPFVLHEKLVPNARSGFFQDDRNRLLLRDRIAWIRNMIDMSADMYVRNQKMDDEVIRFETAVRSHLDRATLETQTNQILALANRVMKQGQLDAPHYDALMRLKSLYDRIQAIVEAREPVPVREDG